MKGSWENEKAASWRVHWLLLPKTWVCFSGSTWQLTAIYNFSARGASTLSWPPWTLYEWDTQAHMQSLETSDCNCAFCVGWPCARLAPLNIIRPQGTCKSPARLHTDTLPYNSPSFRSGNWGRRGSGISPNPSKQEHLTKIAVTLQHYQWARGGGYCIICNPYNHDPNSYNYLPFTSAACTSHLSDC